jgi:GT2 family glycosyltransferase
LLKPVKSLRAAVIIASAGRPSLLRATVDNLHEQRTAFAKVISVPDTLSLPESTDDWEVVIGTRGLAAQRNAGLTALDDVDVVFFFDDDAVVRPDYIENALNFFACHPDIVGLTGRVLLDGARTGEIDPATAWHTLAASMDKPATGRWRSTHQLYGCNFAFRRSSAAALRFDERLPLYSWLEDHDFARRLMKHGALAAVDDCVIVHRAAASGGRQAHARLGYSQVMNPVHLWHKKSFPAWLAAYEMFRPVAKNIVWSISGEQAHWRRKRLAGNLLAAADLLRGRITPERITEL